MAELKISNDLQNAIKKVVLDTFCPVGKVYISVDNVDPSTLFGGTWKRIPGQYLMAGDPNSTMDHKNIGSYIAGGWDKKVSGTAINWNQMPQHNHMGRNYSHNWDAGISIPPGRSYAYSYGGSSAGLWAYSASQWIGGSEINDMVETGSAGGNQPHDHTLPAYPAPTVVLNVWKRVA